MPQRQGFNPLDPLGILGMLREDVQNIFNGPPDPQPSEPNIELGTRELLLSLPVSNFSKAQAAEILRRSDLLDPGEEPMTVRFEYSQITVSQLCNLDPFIEALLLVMDKCTIEQVEEMVLAGTFPAALTKALGSSMLRDDFNRVENMERQFRSTGEYEPPIVALKEGEIIDGAHRAVAFCRVYPPGTFIFVWDFR